MYLNCIAAALGVIQRWEAEAGAELGRFYRIRVGFKVGVCALIRVSYVNVLLTLNNRLETGCTCSLCWEYSGIIINLFKIKVNNKLL